MSPATRSLTSTPMPTPGGRFDADYESPYQYEVRRAKQDVGYWLAKAGDPTRLTQDRADFNARANVAAARLRALENAEVDRLAAIADAPEFEYDEDADTPEPTSPTTTEHED